MISTAQYSFRPRRPLQSVCLAVALVLVTVGISGAHAQTGESSAEQTRLFRIENIAVDEEARTAVIARSQALEKAERAAFDRLIAKLVDRGSRDTLKAVSVDQIQRSILGLEISEERFSAKRYQAKVSYQFNPQLIVQMFDFLQVPFVRTAGKMVEIYHSHRRGITTLYSVEDAVIEAARARQDFENRIRYYRFPDTSLTRRKTISAEAVAALDVKAGIASGIIDSGASPLYISSHWSGQNRLYYAYHLAGERLSGEGDLSADEETQALERLYQLVMDDIDDAWRQQLLVRDQNAQDIHVFIEAQSADHLSKILTRVRGAALVRRLDVGEISLPLSDASLEFRGSFGQLRLALAAQNIAFEAYGRHHKLAVISEGVKE